MFGLLVCSLSVSAFFYALIHGLIYLYKRYMRDNSPEAKRRRLGLLYIDTCVGQEPSELDKSIYNSLVTGKKRIFTKNELLTHLNPGTIMVMDPDGRSGEKISFSYEIS